VQFLSIFTRTFSTLFRTKFRFWGEIYRADIAPCNDLRSSFDVYLVENCWLGYNGEWEKSLGHELKHPIIAVLVNNGKQCSIKRGRHENLNCGIVISHISSTVEITDGCVTLKLHIYHVDTYVILNFNLKCYRNVSNLSCPQLSRN